MKKLKKYENFISENVETQDGLLLYRLSSHHIIDLKEPGDFYVKSLSDVNPDLLKKSSDELYLITVKSDKENIDLDKSEAETVKQGCECVVVKDDSKLELVSVEPFK
jgi:hypothetical protein